MVDLSEAALVSFLKTLIGVKIIRTLSQRHKIFMFSEDDEEQKREPQRSHFIYCSQKQAFHVLTVFSRNKVRSCYITEPTCITHVTCVYFTHSLDFSSERKLLPLTAGS